MADPQVHLLQQPLEQLEIKVDWKTEYLKKEYKLKKKLTLKCYNLTKYGIDLSLEINKLKEGTKNWKRIMETGLDRSRRNMWKGETKRRMWLTIMHKLRYVYLTVYTCIMMLYNLETLYIGSKIMQI